MGRSYFWGLLLILIGTAYILRQVLNIFLPIGTLVGSFVLIYWGVSLIIGKGEVHHHRHHHRRRDRDMDSFSSDNYQDSTNYQGSTNYQERKPEHTDIFSSGEIKATNEQDRYNIIFGNSTIDLRTLPTPLETRTIKIDAVFSKVFIRINPEVPAVIKADCVFSGVRFPNNTQISFGDYTYTTRAYKEGMPYLLIKTDVVFGSADIIE